MGCYIYCICFPYLNSYYSMDYYKEIYSCYYNITSCFAIYFLGTKYYLKRNSYKLYYIIASSFILFGYVSVLLLTHLHFLRAFLPACPPNPLTPAGSDSLPHGPLPHGCGVKQSDGHHCAKLLLCRGPAHGYKFLCCTLRG